MKFIRTRIDGLWVIELELRLDERGYFARSFCQKEFLDHGMDFQISQINRSLTKNPGTIRGMHFQISPKAEAKVVTVLQGKIFDVAVDLRKHSSTFGQWIGTELSAENRKMFYIPKGFAHGFQTLTPNCELQYLMSGIYSPEHASGVRWDDPSFSIEWPLPHPHLSSKDQNWKLMNDRPHEDFSSW